MCVRYIAFSGEDALSEAVAYKCVNKALPGWEFQSWRPRQGGSSGVRQNFQSYVKTAATQPVVVMIDLDDAECPPTLKAQLLAQARVRQVPPRLVLAIVKREVESWLLGDRQTLSDFLGISPNLIRANPEELIDPKTELVELAKNSKMYRNELCPKPNISAKVGVAYNDVLSLFVSRHWNPTEAAQHCPSLQRILERLRRLQEI